MLQQLPWQPPWPVNSKPSPDCACASSSIFNFTNLNCADDLNPACGSKITDAEFKDQINKWEMKGLQIFCLHNAKCALKARKDHFHIPLKSKDGLQHGKVCGVFLEIYVSISLYVQFGICKGLLWLAPFAKAIIDKSFVSKPEYQ